MSEVREEQAEQEQPAQQDEVQPPTQAELLTHLTAMFESLNTQLTLHGGFIIHGMRQQVDQLQAWADAATAAEEKSDVTKRRDEPSVEAEKPEAESEAEPEDPRSGRRPPGRSGPPSSRSSD